MAAAASMHIAMHEAKPNPSAQPSTAVTLGFGNWAYPKLVGQMQDEDIVVRRKAVVAARELLAAPEKLVQCIAAGITRALTQLLQEEDPELRAKAAVTARQLASRELGCRDLVQHGALARLALLLQDPVPEVQAAAFQCLLQACAWPAACKELIADERTLPLLVALAKGPAGDKASMALQMLNLCAKVRNNDDALSQIIDAAAGIPACAGLLAADNNIDMQEGAAQLMAVLCSVRPDAKQQAVDAGAIPRLLELLRDGPALSPKLAASAATALMMITVCVEAKEAVRAVDGVAVLVEALRGAQEERLCVAVLECIANVAENQRARAALNQLDALVLIKQVQSDCVSPLLDKAASQAAAGVMFKHV